MRVGDRHYRTIWDEDGVVKIIDQRKLPWVFEEEELGTVESVCGAIADMHVRGAGCIGATAGYGMYVAAARGEDMEAAGAALKATRPTAKNLEWAVERQMGALEEAGGGDISGVTLETARAIADEDAEWCRRIGEHGMALIREVAGRKAEGEAVNILTHCNAGWLAFVDYGSATAPIYAAHDAGIPVHVWVDETRPRNQGARLTAWELGQHGVPHTVVADNVGGHLMQHGMVDLVITGTDRTTRTGDVANKIGTYLKALAARDNGVPFYVALPSSTFDWEVRDGVKGIPIEERGGDEVRVMEGVIESGSEVVAVDVVSPGSGVSNYAFDVTPARLVSGLITERGICEASEAGVLGLYPEQEGAVV
ncbi:MAG: S-methyl-5-thioribose-1-phosphate isomerase [Verrucomicrobiota bacterium]